MKIRIEVLDGLEEDEVVIRCAQMDETIQRIHRFIADQETAPMVFYKDSTEFYFPLGDVLFFETEGESVYAHTAGDSFRVTHRLYELEQLLPGQFVRISKSTIVNARQVHAITRNLAAASLVELRGTHKHVYVSRRYFAALKEKLQRSNR